MRERVDRAKETYECQLQNNFHDFFHHLLNEGWKVFSYIMFFLLRNEKWNLKAFGLILPWIKNTDVYQFALKGNIKQSVCWFLKKLQKGNLSET